MVKQRVSRAFECDCDTVLEQGTPFALTATTKSSTPSPGISRIGSGRVEEGTASTVSSAICTSATDLVDKITLGTSIEALHFSSLRSMRQFYNTYAPTAGVDLGRGYRKFSHIRRFNHAPPGVIINDIKLRSTSIDLFA